ncbi:MAG: GTP-binding protein, partial [Candidatus Cloacimonetes bacterium]|nr:GTP-binding protein [Candidatus Cloacimonadota bacterium]
LTSLPAEIGELKNLQVLHLGGNKLTSLPAVIGKLENLVSLDLRLNNLTSLPAEIGNLKNYVKISSARNPLTNPPLEVCEEGIKAIRNYFEELQKDSEVINEAKVLFVGQGEVGKTCLMKKLLKPNEDVNLKEVSTKGIDVKDWHFETDKKEDFRVNFWDFGGQEILHSTHQFFLTKRSLYILVWDSRMDNQIFAFDYWLNVIKLLSDNSPVIIVLSKSELNRNISVAETELMERFKNIVTFCKVSAITGDGITELKALIKQEVQKLTLVGTKVPKSFINIRKKLEALTENGENYISYKEYLKICNSFALKKEKADFIRDYYHDLGIFLNFKDNEILSDYFFLQPEWATNAVYCLLENHTIQDNNGRFLCSELPKYFSGKYEDKLYPVFLELMRKFELCFPIDNGKGYIIPELLPQDKPKNLRWTYKNNLKVVLKYKFLPNGIITRLTSRNYKDIGKHDYWRYGVAFQIEDAVVMVREIRLEREIKIYISGKQKNEMLFYVLNEIAEINRTLQNPSLDVFVTCTCDECRESEEPYLFDYDYLERAKAKNKQFVECQNSLEDISLPALLSGMATSKSKLDKFLDNRAVYYAKDIAVEFGGTVLSKMLLGMGGVPV